VWASRHVASFAGPGLLGGVRVENTLQVAEKVRYALRNPGGLGVELVPARVLIAHEIAAVVTQDSEITQRDRRAGRQCPVPHQAFLRGAHGDHVRGRPAPVSRARRYLCAQC
jgi:hypothetical protein